MVIRFMTGILIISFAFLVPVNAAGIRGPDANKPLALTIQEASPLETEGSVLNSENTTTELEVPNPTREEVEASLMQEFAASFRPGVAKDRILQLEEKIQRIAIAVPRNEDGSLSHGVVQYVLHRFFVLRGWSVRGLQAGEKKNTGTGKNIETFKELGEWLPRFIHKFLEQLHQGRGLSVRELAVLAATIEDTIHKESHYWLAKVMGGMGKLGEGKRYSPDDVSTIVESFVMSFHMGGTYIGYGPLGLQQNRERFLDEIADWPEKLEWAQSVKNKILNQTVPGPVGLLDLQRVVEAIGEQYGSVKDKECSKRKHHLLQFESKKAGRVLLKEFYVQGLDAGNDFKETKEHLREIGALDETDPKQPMVIVANYVASRANCMSMSQYYQICCRNECEDLMGQLEHEIRAELASPEEVLDLVSRLSSDTVDAPRQLSPVLRKHLSSIAQHNEGHVPLHGRLFAQWMHHAFPRECPFPHEVGTTKTHEIDSGNYGLPRSRSRESQKGKLSPSALLAFLDDHDEECNGSSNETHCKHQPTGDAAREFHHFVENELPWSHNEELIQPLDFQAALKKKQPAKGGVDWKVMARRVFVFVTLLSMAYAANSLAFGEGDMKPSCKMV